MRFLLLLLAIIVYAQVGLVATRKKDIKEKEVKVNQNQHWARLQQKMKKGADTKEKNVTTTKEISWEDKNWCKKVTKILQKKKLAVHKMIKVVRKMLFDKTMPNAEKVYHIDQLNIFQQELNETENMIMNSFEWLDDVLEGDYKDLINLQTSSKARLEALRDATLREEQEYNLIMKAEVKCHQLLATTAIFLNIYHN